jgi:hypothetical protein
MEPAKRHNDYLADAGSVRLTADYDRNADVLYVHLGAARPAEAEERPAGVLMRFGLDDDAPCGVTVMGVRKNGWLGRRSDLAALVADFLGESEDSIAAAITAALCDQDAPPPEG